DGGGQVPVAGEARERSGLAHEATRQHDERRVHPAQVVVGEAPAAHGPGRERFGDDVGPAHEIEDDVAGFGPGQVDGAAQLARVHVPVEGRPFDVGDAVEVGAARAGGVEMGGRLDPHDGGAVVGQDPGDGGSGHGPHEV